MKHPLLGLALFLLWCSLSAYATGPSSYDDGWIKITQISKDVYRFDENFANCYLVIGKTEAVLIDAAYGASDLQKLCSEFTKLPITVINTHGHIDHISGDPFFSKVFIHEKDASKLEKGISSGEREWTLKDLMKNPLFPKGFDSNKWNKTPIQPLRKLSGGEVLEFGDIKLEVISTPGHTPGSICLLDRERHLLYTGDTFVPAEMWIQLPESNYRDWLDSADKLVSLQPFVQRILPGHLSPCNTNMLEELKWAVLDIRSGKDDAFQIINPVGGQCLKSQFPFFAIFHQ